MNDIPLTRGQIACGIAFHVIGLAVVILVIAGVISPWFLL